MTKYASRDKLTEFCTSIGIYPRTIHNSRRPRLFAFKSICFSRFQVLIQPTEDKEPDKIFCAISERFSFKSKTPANKSIFDKCYHSAFQQKHSIKAVSFRSKPYFLLFTLLDLTPCKRKICQEVLVLIQELASGCAPA